MSNDSTSGSTSDTAESIANKLRGPIERSQGLAESLKNDLPPHYAAEAEHLETDFEVLERWNEDAADEGVEALAGAPVVIDTAQKRVQYLQDEIGQSDQDLTTRLEEIEDTTEEIEDVVDALEITTEVYVTYVNREFVARYFDRQETIERILLDAGREDVEELGLFPLSDLFGESVEDLAFPDDREVDLGEENRTYWKSTSDGGQIA